MKGSGNYVTSYLGTIVAYLLFVKVGAKDCCDKQIAGDISTSVFTAKYSKSIFWHENDWVPLSAVKKHIL